MVDLATIGVEFKANMQRFLQDLDKAERASNKTADAVTAAGKKQERASDSAVKLGGAFSRMGKQAEEAADGNKKLSSSVGSTEKAMVAAAAKVGTLIGAFVSLNKAVGAAEVWTNMSNRLKLVTNGAAELAAAQNAVVKIAMATGGALEPTAELYQRIANNQQQLGISSEQMARVTETVAKSIAMSGGSAASAQAAITQFAQALASGTLRGDELNSIMEQAPALAQTLAAGLGVTVGELRKMGSEGEITSRAIITAIQAQAGAVDSAFGKTSMTISQAMTNLDTAFTQMVGGMDQASGASAVMATAINWLAQNLGTLATLVATGAVAIGLVALVANFGMVAAAAGTATAAVTAFVASLGPIGWSVAAVTALTVAYMALQEEIEGTGAYAMSLGDTFAVVGEMAWEAMGLAEEGAIKASDANAQAAEDTMGQWEKTIIFLGNAFDTLATAIVGTAQGVKGAMDALAAAMTEAFARAFNWIIERGELVVNSIASGIDTIGGALSLPSVGRVSFGRVATSGASFGDIGAAFDAGKASVRITSGMDFVNQIRGRVGQRVAARRASQGAGSGRGSSLSGGDDDEKKGGGKKGGGKKASKGGKSDADRIAEEMKKRAQAYEEARIAAEAYIRTEEERYRRELAGMGKGSQWREQNAAENQINDKYQKDRERLQSELRTGKIDEEYYRKHLAVVDSTNQQALALDRAYWQEKLRLQGSWEVGASEALQNYADMVANVAASTEQLISSAFKGMEDALVQFVTTGKLDFKSLADSIIADMARIAIQQSITGPLAGWMVGLFGGGTPAIGSAGSFNLTTGFVSALGNVYNTPDISAFSGQIVSSPTWFGGPGPMRAYATGGNLMGEAGPEAILPLKRGPGGYLGVRAEGGGGTTNVSIVINTDGSSKRNASGPKEDQMGQLGKMVEGAVMGIILREQRPGGALA